MNQSAIKPWPWEKFFVFTRVRSTSTELAGVRVIGPGLLGALVDFSVSFPDAELPLHPYLVLYGCRMGAGYPDGVRLSPNVYGPAPYGWPTSFREVRASWPRERTAFRLAFDLPPQPPG